MQTDPTTVESTETQTETPPDRLRQFYERLQTNPAIRGIPDSYGDFTQGLADPDRRQRFYNSLSESGKVRGLPDYDQFNQAVEQARGDTPPMPALLDMNVDALRSPDAPEQTGGQRRLQERLGEEETGRFYDLYEQKKQLERERAPLSRKRAAGLSSPGTGAPPAVAFNPNLRLTPDEEQRVQDLTAQIKEIEEEIGELKPDGWGARMLDWAGQFAQASGEMAAGTLDAVAIGAKGLDDLFGADWQPGDVDEQTTAQLAAWLRSELEDRFPTDPTLQDEYAGKFFGALGSFLSYAGAGIGAAAARGATARGAARLAGREISEEAVQREARRAAGGVSTLAAGGGGASRVYHDAKAMGSSDEDARFASYLGTIPGVIQVLPVLRVMRRFSEARGGAAATGWNRAVESLKTGGQEAFVETLGQYGFDEIARNLYDEDRDAFENLMDAMATAGPAGAVSDFLLTSVGRRAPRPGQRRQPPPGGQPEADTAPEEGTPPQETSSVAQPPSLLPSAPAEAGGPPVGQLREAVRFDWNPDAPAGEQIAQLESERERLERLGNTTPDAGVARDAEQALELIDEHISRIQQEGEGEASALPEAEPPADAPPPGTSPENALPVIDDRYSMYQDEQGALHLLRDGQEVGRSSRYWPQAEREYIARRWTATPRPDVDQAFSPEAIEQAQGYFPQMAAQEGQHLLDFHDAIQMRMDEGQDRMVLDEAQTDIIDRISMQGALSAEEVRSFRPGEWQDRPVLRTKVARPGEHTQAPDEIAADVNREWGTEYTDSDIVDFWIRYHSGELDASSFSDPLTASLAEKAGELAGRPYTEQFHHELAGELSRAQGVASEQAISQASELLARQDIDTQSWFNETGELNYQQAAQELRALAESDPEFAGVVQTELSPQAIEELRNEHQQSIEQSIEQTEPPAPAGQAQPAGPPSGQATGETPGASFAQRQIEAEFERAQGEYVAAREAFEVKRRELDQELADDAPNLFGERASQSESQLFDERADPSRRDPALKPFADRLQAARERVNRLRSQLENMQSQADPSLFDEGSEQADPVKQPWELTREEFVEKYTTEDDDGGSSFSNRAAMWDIRPKSLEVLPTMDAGYKDGPDFYRYIAVKRALNEGKPVPENVLADYPDLQQASEQAPDAPQTRIISPQRYEEARRELLDRITNRLGMGLDPKTFKLSAEVAIYHIESGAYKIGSFVNRMVNHFGERIRPHLGDIYNYVRRDPSIKEQGLDARMSSFQEVSDFFDGNHTQRPGGYAANGEQDGAYGQTINQEAAEGAGHEPPSPPDIVLRGQFAGGWDPGGAAMTHFLDKSLLGWRQTFESASDRLRRTSGMAPLGELIDQVFDQEAHYLGIFQSHMNAAVRAANARDRIHFRLWAEQWDQGNEAVANAILTRMSDEGAALTNAWVQFADRSGELNQKVGVQVFDPAKQGYRPIGKLSRYFPRRLQDWAWNAIHARTRHPKDYARFVQVLIENGKIKDESEAAKYIADNSRSPLNTRDDYFAAMEQARGEGFPPDMYDYTLDTAIDYGQMWAKRLAQIEVLGQEGTKFGETFDKVIRQVQDPKLKKYLERVRSRVYNEEPNSGWGRMIATANMLATGVQLGNYRTAAQNWITGAGLNYVAYGGYAVKSTRQLFLIKPAEQAELEMKGVWKDDLLSVQHDLSDSVPGLLSRFTGLSMKWGGYKFTERLIRAHAYFTGKNLVRSLIQNAGTNPLTGKSKQLIAFFERNNFDYTRLLAENGEGPYTDRALRYIVNMPQGSYRIDMTPVAIDEPIGRMVLKYRKYGTQVERLKWRNHIEPFVKSLSGGERISVRDPVSGQTVDQRAYDFVAMMRLLALPLVYGSANKWVRWTAFGTLAAMAGPDWEDIQKALDDDERARAAALALQMGWEGAVMSGIMGNLQTPVQWGRDVAEQKSMANPFDPPAFGPGKSTADFVQTWMDQGTVTAGDIDFWANRTFSFYNTFMGNRASLQFQEAMGMDRPHLEYYRLGRAEVQKEVRRYAEDVGVPDSKRRRGEGGFRPGPQTPVNRGIGDSIILGRPEQAQQRLKAYLDTLEYEADVRGAVSSAKRHVQNRQPIVMGGQYRHDVRLNFLEWAEKNLHPDKVERIKTLEASYRETARQAGLMADPTPLQEHRQQIQAQTDPEPLSDAERWRLYRNLMGWD